MYNRDIEPEFLELVKSYPIVTVIGPRQSGKTTLVKKLFPQKKYVNLEELDTRNLAISDPRQFLGQLPDGAILDEIQRAPQLLSYIQVIVDDLDKKGMFILTGSHQLELQEAVSRWSHGNACAHPKHRSSRADALRQDVLRRHPCARDPQVPRLSRV